MEFKNIKITPEVEGEIAKNKTKPISLIISPEDGYTVDALEAQVLKLPGVDKSTVEKTENYVFAELTPAQIITLEKSVEVKRFWINKQICTMTSDSLNTVNTPVENTFYHQAFCSDITWAVIDNGVDATHEALKDSNVIDIDLTGEGPVGGHGTHVAGIIAGWYPPNNFHGVAPKCQLYNFKVVGEKQQGVKLVIKAMEKIRDINKQSGKIVIHGANLSWGIPITDSIKLFQPGLSPVCLEANLLVNSGVVLSVSAGNYGAQAFMVPTDKDGSDTWASIAFGTIADPGSAELPITVGSTHKQNPDKYGISVFSSKGPTADGRIKPDMVAPGEKILSSIPGNQYQELSGTSQAAPYVSGAAAQLIHAYPKLIGKPDHVKQILMQSCRNLNRSPFFQGNGLVDLRRALQIAGSLL